MEKVIRHTGVVLCILFTVSIKAQNDTLLPVKQNSLWGYCNMHGNLVIPFQFEHATLYDVYGLAQVKMNGSAYLINSFGEVVSDTKCQEIKTIGDGIYACYNGDEWKLHGNNLKQGGLSGITAIEPGGIHWIFYTRKGAGLLSITGQIVQEDRFDQITKSEDENLLLLYKDSMLGVATVEGKIVWEPLFEAVDFRSPGIFMARSGDKIAIRSLNDKIVTDTVYAGLNTRNGFPQVILYDTLGRSSGFHLNTGKSIQCDTSHYVDFYDKDYLLYFTPGGLNLLDSAMNTLFERPYESIRREYNGFVVRQNGLYGFCNMNGKLIHEARYTSISRMVQNTAITRLQSKSGIIHALGSEIAPPEFEKVEVYNTTAKAYRNNLVTVYEFEEDGSVSSETEFTNFKTISLGGYKDSRKPRQSSENRISPIWFYDQNARKWGLQTETGKVLIQPSYDYVERLKGNYSKIGIKTEVKCEKDVLKLTFVARWGLVDHESGVIIIDPFFASVFQDTVSTIDNIFILTDLKLYYHIFYANTGIKYGPFMYIGESNGYNRNIAISGSWASAKNDTTNRKLCTSEKLLAHTCSWFNFKNKSLFADSLKNLLIQNGQFRIWNDHKQGFRKAEYPYVSDFTEHAAVFGTHQNLFGVINQQGDTLIPPEFDKIEMIHNNKNLFFLTHKTRETYGYIRENGEWAFEQKLPYNTSFNNGKAVFLNSENHELTVADTSGMLSHVENITKTGYFSEGLLPVKSGKYWTYLNSELKTELGEKSWYWAGQFANGIAPVKHRYHYEYINQMGEPEFEKVFEKALAFEQFGGLVKIKGKWGLINESGAIKLKPKYSQYKYKKGDSVLALNKKGGWYLFDMDANPINRKGLAYYKPFREGFAFVRTQNGKSGLLSKNGTLKTTKNKESLLSVQGTFVVLFREESGVYLADTNFNMISSGEYINYKFGSEGIIFGRNKKREWHALDENGTLLFILPGKPIYGFKEGFAIIELPDKRMAYIDTKGKLAFGEFFTKARPFEKGIAYVNTINGLGIINSRGVFIISPKYKYISPFKEGMASVQTISLINIANAKGKNIMNGGFDYVKPEPPGVFRVESADNVGWISQTGQVIWRPSR